ncbi:uncharacterized protein EI97DRAFT_442779 [Westerdykella ornata]|uniref:Transglycosylase SLT domain-containing protein n=1 Tax=Westerdykella ornata TaxID=318751 RepID=A0A6A6JH99_WESOR|nr:uncharacterized protein EI97DRAFT_442779 [Westerdykella ornata]KAF2275782.1 hypothetical protein EI97DRAFT_442779 [Westerdykella ornata]
MRSSYSLLFLGALAHARPTLRPREGSYSTNNVLAQEYQQKWYSEAPAHVQNGPAIHLAATQDTPGPGISPSQYKCFGPMLSDFPAYETWTLTFEQLWQINEPEMTKINGGTQYNQLLKDAILAQSKKNHVDPRIILAMVMQESTGNVNAPCTGPETRDCGLLQIRYGRKFTDADSIAGMIQDGMEGLAATDSHPAWPGYVNYFNLDRADMSWIDAIWAGNPFLAARLYNMGYLDSEDLSQTRDASYKSTYAQDIAARLFGWDGLTPRTC